MYKGFIFNFYLFHPKYLFGELFVALGAVPWCVSVFIAASGPVRGYQIISEMKMSPLLEPEIENFPKG